MSGTREFLSALGIALVGSLFCLGALSLGVGSPKNPGEGFMPLLCGGVLLIISRVYLAQRRDTRVPRQFSTLLMRGAEKRT